MATTDDLVISIRADVGRLESQLRNIDQQLGNTTRQGNETASAIKSMALQFLSLGAAVEGLKKLTEVNREFGILKAGLETATGSIQGANQAFAALQQFAQTTPYSLQQAVDGFTKLVNLGLTPSEAALQSYGDTSAALGKDLSQMIEAVADAATGEFERLKEFGIKAKNQGDTISFTFRGVTENVKNNATEIENYLIKLGQVNFDGAMKKRMESLDGAISNLSDSFDALFFQIGESGATEILNTNLRRVGDAFNTITAKVKELPIGSINDAFQKLGDAVLLVAGYKATKFVGALALSTQETIKNIAAQSALRAETLAQATADAAAAGLAERRAIVEKDLAISAVARAKATTNAAIATQQAAIADLERATMEARLAAGTQNATAADLAKTMAAERVAAANAAVTVAANAEAAAIARATTATAANTAAATASATAQQALETATTNATIAGRASGTMLTALGGPIGAVITALGLAATAWVVFGDNAETAAEKAINASQRIKNGLNDTNDEMRVQLDALMDVNAKIRKLEETLANWKGGIRLIDKEVSLADLKQQKAIIEENINNLKLTKVLNEFLGENKQDDLTQFGVKKDTTPQVDQKKQEQEAKKLAQLKEAAQKYIDTIAESNMSEMQLDGKHYNESLAQLNEYLNKRVITRQQYDNAVLDLNGAFNNKIIEDLLEQSAKEEEIALKQQEREDEARTRRLEKIQDVLTQAKNAGLTELEQMDAQHAKKMAKTEELMVGESQFKEELRNAELILEQQHQAKRLDLILGTGNKIQEMTKAFQKNKLQGALSFFAADFGGLSQHSRKMFELTKAARLADAAINIPSTVIAAAKHGSEIGGWPLGLAMGAAALASQLSQLKAIQSASFGGGSSGGGGAGGGSTGLSSAQTEPQQPIQQRFVNINLSGSDNSMYSKGAVRDLITRINEEVKDGAVLRVL